MCLCTDQQGNVWVGTEDDSVWRIDARTGKSKQYTTADGIGDNSCYAIACDRKNRIWCGSLNHGVSVYNGKTWQTYEPVGGLSRHNSLNGVIGEHVFAMKLCEKTGDIWISSNCGVGIYSESKDTWKYLTRANDGLPSDQVDAIAFDKNGDAYLGTQCDGIAMASLDASGNYARWRVITGPDRTPLVPAGDGLPTSLINDILVAGDGTVYVATTTGLAWSKDHGYEWKFIRGKNWADKVRGLYGGVPARWSEFSSPTLAEDYCTCLAEGTDGSIWVGHRQKPSEAIMSNGRFSGNLGISVYANCMLAAGAGSIVGCYGEGVVAGNGASLQSPQVATVPTISKLPAGAAPPSLADLTLLQSQLKSLPRELTRAEYIGEDWLTEGDAIGRYGREYSVLCAMGTPWFDDVLERLPGYYHVAGEIGPHHLRNDALRHWIEWIKTDNLRSLYAPTLGIRRQAEWDDHGEVYSPDYEGPDIWVSLDVPAGFHRASVYFFNKDGHTGDNRFRDYLLELRSDGPAKNTVSQAPPLAHCRVTQFWGGEFKQFLIRGPRSYWLRIARNYSKNTIVSGIFLDKLTGPPTEFDDFQIIEMGRVRYEPPSIEPVVRFDVPLSVAASIWDELDLAIGVRALVPLQRYARLFAYRAAANVRGSPPTLLARWRWSLCLWNAGDRSEFKKTMAQAWASLQDLNPFLKTREWRPYSPGTVTGSEENLRRDTGRVTGAEGQ